MPLSELPRLAATFLTCAAATVLCVFAGPSLAQPSLKSDGVLDEAPVPPQSERDRRAEIRRTLDQRPQKWGSRSDDSRKRLSDEERRDLRKDIGDAARDVYRKNKRKGSSSERQ